MAATTTNSYVWRDGAVQASSSFAKTNQTTFNTTYTYGASGHLTSIAVGGGRPRTVTLTNDLNGQVIRRDEADNL